MGNLFNLDNGFFRTLSKLVDCFYLSFLFFISCIPIFTVGTAMTAMYYTVQKVIRHDRGYVGKAYWHAFRTNFKQTTLTWLIVLFLGVITLLDFIFMRQMAAAGHTMGKMYPFFLVLLVLEVLWCAYLFPYMARFVNTMRGSMKNAALIAVLNLPWTLLILVLILVALLAMYLLLVYFTPAICFVPGLFTLALNLIMERIFRKYMSEEDKAEEDERNREYKN